jgi:hypothetical protein
MNSLYTLGVRQTNSLQSDLERLRNGDNSASLLGSFTHFAFFSVNDGGIWWVEAAYWEDTRVGSGLNELS